MNRLTHWRLFAVFTLLQLAWLLTSPVLAQSGEGSHKLVQAIREQLVKEVDLVHETDLLWLDLRRFYTERRFQPVWFTDKGLNERGQLMVETIKSAENHGLNPDDYNICFFERHCDDELASQRVWVELLLTKSLMQYIEHMMVGRLSPQDMELNWHIEKPSVDTQAWLQTIVDDPDFAQALQSLQPPHHGYRRLQTALLKYLQLQSSGGWPSIPPGPLLQIWDAHEQIALLRRRLQAEGDLLLGPVENELLFDETVKLAVEHFQVRYGIEVDGMVGPQTRAAMNVPIEERIKQMQFNLERWRWLPRNLGERYLLVNTAGYELVVYEYNAPLYVMRVIAGTPERPTPAVVGPLESIIFNPYWYIPRKIALNDVVPRQKRNPNFFKSVGIRVFKNQQAKLREIPASRIDWEHVNQNNFPYQLRQDPGPQNSLGAIKFKFTNDYALYLHDTPKQRLFDRETRAFSSGCIRVEDAVYLAEYLLQNENGWTKDQIRTVIDSGETVSIELTSHIPLYLVYWTAWVSRDNQVYFRKDVYGWDKSQSQCR
ncbi:L,D-transpeptidase family protein [Kaarinaea lacus]